MTAAQIEELFDRLARVSAQRWVLTLIVVAAAGAAAAATGFTGSDPRPVLTGLTMAVALAAAALPDSHAATVVLAMVVARWAVIADDHTTPWVLVVAICLLIVHATVALMALTPATATVDPETLLRWSVRTAAVAAATAAMWLLVVVLERWQPPGSTGLTLAALVLVGAFAVIATVLSQPDRR